MKFQIINVLVCVVLSLSVVLANRTIVSLDGTWELKKGGDNDVGGDYSATISVPSFADQASGSVGSGDWWWYKKIFLLNQSETETALLKVHKAKYGKYVYINGHLVGDHQNNFTPSYFDIREHLNFSGENTLEIRIGEKGFPTNSMVFQSDDAEKKVYNPGIYDAVEIFLADNPTIEKVQVNPKNNNALEVQLVVKNESGQDYTGDVAFTVNEFISNDEVVTGKVSVSIPAHSEKIVTTELILPNAHYWSPENPFLYLLKTETSGDSQIDRFGMRTFEFNASTNMPELNGEAYPLLGTNVCVNRFYEDPNRAMLPWDTTWVIKLAHQMKAMNWNSARIHIGFAPDFWYDIFDEVGLLIQDEYHAWTGPWGAGSYTQTTEQLVIEATDWIYERQTHPSVVIWDMTNESKLPQSYDAITSVRSIDIQNRTWENSFLGQHSPGDPTELHPYLFLGDNFPFDLSGLDTLQDGYKHNLGWNEYNYKGDDAPMINNEYGWLWINRDGSPTSLTSDIYEYLLGGKGKGTYGTEEGRRYTYATYEAALTEFWRETRDFIGMQHFTVLSYSKPGEGATSDNFLNPISELNFDPYFEVYVKDAFAPVGLAINHYANSYLGGQEYALNVSVYNDSRETFTGDVRFKVVEGGVAITKEGAAVYVLEKQSVTVLPLEKSVLNFTITMPSVSGNYSLVAEYYDGSDWVQSVRDFYLSGGDALSKNNKVVASSVRDDNVADFAVDGLSDTRWESGHGADDEWIYIDLGTVKQFSGVSIEWEAAYAKQYSIEISDDAQEWHEIHNESQGKGGNDIIALGSQNAQYIRLHCKERSGEYGYSLFELSVIESLTIIDDDQEVSSSSSVTDTESSDAIMSSDDSSEESESSEKQEEMSSTDGESSQNDQLESSSSDNGEYTADMVLSHIILKTAQMVTHVGNTRIVISNSNVDTFKLYTVFGEKVFAGVVNDGIVQVPASITANIYVIEFQ
ncbi:MAG: discoidin domain-containing protein [Reichenbachiella sp.]